MTLHGNLSTTMCVTFQSCIYICMIYDIYIQGLSQDLDSRVKMDFGGDRVSW